MARTLIGNIKGKDGRGITSIEKTGTTGSVDTYTITYTDSSTSTFTVNNSDSISLQRQIVPSAAVESSSTASQTYAAGDYVVVNGVLRKVKAAIAKGNAISDSNSTATTVTGELATLGDSASKAPRIFTGTVVKHFNGGSGGVNIFSRDEYVRLVGRPFDQNRDYVAAMNADGGALNSGVYCVTYYPSGGNLFAGINSNVSANVRINYLVVCGSA